jgi:hypothetical protein
MRIRETNSVGNRRGAALIAVAILMVGMGILSLALLSIGQSAANAQRQSRDESAALYVAEAGLSDAVCSLAAGASGNKGSEQNRIEFGGTSYWVDTTDNGDGTYSLVSTGLDGRGGARVELLVRSNDQSFYRWAAFGNEWLLLDSQAKVDSYNSSNGTYASQAVNGSGSYTYALDHGSTGSNGNISLKQNSKVFGSSNPGVDGSISILGNATVSGTTTPLHEPFELPEIELPSIASTGDLDIAKNKTSNVGPGDLHFSRLNANTGSTLNVTGPANVIFDSFTMFSGSKLTVHAENGPVHFYVLDNFILNSNTTIASTTYKPADIEFNLLSDNIIDLRDHVILDNLDFDSNAKLYGTMYAPHALINIDSNFELFGSLVAQQVDLDSNSRIHFDEALLESGEDDGGFTTLCWRELPYHPSKSDLAGY